MFPCKILLLTLFVLRWQPTQLSAEAAWCFRNVYQQNTLHPVCRSKKPAGWSLVWWGQRSLPQRFLFYLCPSTLSFLPSFLDLFFTFLGFVPLNLELTSDYYMNCDVPVQLLICEEDLEPAPSCPRSSSFQTLVWCVDHLRYCRSWVRQGIFMCINIR